MRQPETPSVQTRPSLIAGLQAGDETRWREFFRQYGPVIRGFARKAGLTEVEADDVVQETCIGVSRNVGEYHYDPSRCRFKTWLLNLASWRVKNQFARRKRWDDRKLEPTGEAPDGSGSTIPVELASPDTWERIWETEWREGLVHAALEVIRANYSATQFQVFDLNVLKEWPARDVARALGIGIANVYLTKHRISSALKREVARLEQRDNP